MGKQKTYEDLELELAASLTAEAEAIAKVEALQTSKSQLESDNEELTAEVAALKEEVQRLAATPDDKEQENGVGKCFTYNDKSYKVLVAAVRIPGIGKRTALEILNDTAAQKWLVEKNSGCIQEQQ
jgi:hypothetical protein